MSEHTQKIIVDGNEACARVSYLFSEIVAIYPITPSSDMAQHVDEFSNSDKDNIFDNGVLVKQLQSEAGAAGAMHGILQAGSLSTTYTASQGLLLMIPNIYKMVGELLPGVIHVAARSIATRALSIFGDHQDVYATRQTGISIIASSCVQEAHDMAALSHLCAIKTISPFLHFFDGFRTSHEVQKIKEIKKEDLFKLIDFNELDKFRKNALDPIFNPITRGGAENDDIYFQGREAQNIHFKNIIKECSFYFDKLSKITRKNYAPFVYFGPKDATKIIVAMGSVSETIEKTVKILNEEKNEKVGFVKVMMYRPFAKELLLKSLPSSTEKIAVLDRTKEPGSVGEPLFLDVASTLKDKNVLICHGRYGLSSKNTSIDDINAVFANLNSKNPKQEFTLSIKDDLTNLSLSPIPLSEEEEDNLFTSIIYGFGGDGSVSASKGILKVIGNETPLNVQGYFSYDSRKNGSLTTSYLRVSKEKITSPYYIQKANFISCAKEVYILKYDIHKKFKKNSIFLLNTSLKHDSLLKILPYKFKKALIDNKVNFYTINANKIAKEVGNEEKTNIIMQSCFFKLNEDRFKKINFEEKLQEIILKLYSNVSENVKKGNLKCVKSYKEIDKISLEKINLDKAIENEKVEKNYFNDFVLKISNNQGYQIPTSTFKKYNLLDGSFKNNMAVKEKRNLAKIIPKWKRENCIQCNKCVLVCPHATIRAFLVNDDEIKKSPIDFKEETLTPFGIKKDQKIRYKIHIDRENCVGCSLCVEECPGLKGRKALEMETNFFDKKQNALTNYLYYNTSYKSGYYPSFSPKEVGFLKPYFETSGACAGCGQTPYYKLLSQLFGDKLLIANATGCSSIYSGSTPFSPFATDSNNRGPAWANSLFEDNAEFGFGMVLSYKYKKSQINKIITNNKEKVSKKLKEILERYLNKQINDEEVNILISEIRKSNNKEIKKILDYKSDLYKKSIWSIGGDGWAYDIGFSGIDHVLSSNENINILVLDTQAYSNTGGQSSKATPIFAKAKFAAGGKRSEKKDLAKIAMSYNNTYVAQISMGANITQTIKALKEAQDFCGPSIVIAYSPCIEHKIEGGMAMHQKLQKLASESGFFPIFRYSNGLIKLDSQKPNFEKYFSFIKKQRRFPFDLNEKDIKTSFDSLSNKYKQLQKHC